MMINDIQDDDYLFILKVYTCLNIIGESMITSMPRAMPPNQLGSPKQPGALGSTQGYWPGTPYSPGWFVYEFRRNSTQKLAIREHHCHL